MDEHTLYILSLIGGVIVAVIAVGTVLVAVARRYPKGWINKQITRLKGWAPVPRRDMEQLQQYVNEFFLAYVDTHRTFMEYADTALKDGYRIMEIDKQVTSLNSAQQLQPLELKSEILKEAVQLQKDLLESDRRLAQVSQTVADLEVFRDWALQVLAPADSPTTNSTESTADIVTRIDELAKEIQDVKRVQLYLHTMLTKAGVKDIEPEPDPEQVPF